MRNSIGKKILIVFFVPFLLIFGALSVYVSYTIAQYFTDWIELEIKGISDINSAQLEGRIDSVCISVQSAAMVLESIPADARAPRTRADEIICSMFTNQSIYNAWLAFEPNAFDGKDHEHRLDYPGAKSGRFILSYVMEEGEIVVAPDMEEESLDDPEISPWYTIPRDEDILYIDVDNELPNIYDYGTGSDPVYTMSIVAPIHRDGKVIGCVGADILFDTMTFGIDNANNAAVAVFYPNGRVFFAEDLRFAEESISTLRFSPHGRGLVEQAFANGSSLFLPDEYSPFLGERAFTYFHPIRSEGMGENSLFLYVALPRAALFESLTPVMKLVVAITITVLLVLFAILIYVFQTVSRPIRELTLSANAISQGNLETEISFFSESRGEMGLLSRSLRRMVEQFRVHIIQQEQMQEERMLHSLLYVSETSDNIDDTLSSLALMLCRHFKIFKTSIIISGEGKASIMACCTWDGQAPHIRPTGDFFHHSQVQELVGPHKKLVFLNSLSIQTHRVAFIDEETVSMCIVPMWAEDALYGYILFENNDRNNTFSAGTESALVYLTRELTEWLLEQQPQDSATLPELLADQTLAADDAMIVADAMLTASDVMQSAKAAAEEEDPLIVAARRISGLFVDTALAAMGGLTEVYKKALLMLGRMLPETMEKLAATLNEGEIEDFAVEIHGLKGALNNIGASELGSQALLLESAAKSGALESCRQNYPAFAEALGGFLERILPLGQSEDAQRDGGEKAELLAALPKARLAMEGYDSMEALEILAPLSQLSFAAAEDQLLLEIILALEAFDHEKALENLKQLEVLVNDTAK